jgi:hypothetical protein
MNRVGRGIVLGIRIAAGLGIALFADHRLPPR